MAQDRDSQSKHGDIRPYIPTAILSLGFLLGVALQTYYVSAERGNLNATRTQQETAYQQAVNIRTQLEAIATDTAQLAADGDPAARAIRDALRQQGITLPVPTKQP